MRDVGDAVCFLNTDLNLIKINKSALTTDQFISPKIGEELSNSQDCIDFLLLGRDGKQLLYLLSTEGRLEIRQTGEFCSLGSSHKISHFMNMERLSNFIVEVAWNEWSAFNLYQLVRPDLSIAHTLKIDCSELS